MPNIRRFIEATLAFSLIFINLTGFLFSHLVRKGAFWQAPVLGAVLAGSVVAYFTLEVFAEVRIGLIWIFSGIAFLSYYPIEYVLSILIIPSLSAILAWLMSIGLAYFSVQLWRTK
jgi:hypothetical protein